MSKNRFDFGAFAQDANSDDVALAIAKKKAEIEKLQRETIGMTGHQREVWAQKINQADRELSSLHQMSSGDRATDPPVSEAQRKAMGAAASGHSNLGISSSVGKEFIDADKGGKLPERRR